MQFGESADWRDEDLYAIGAQPLRGRRTAAYRRLPWIRLTLTSAAFIALIAIYAPEREMRDRAAPHSLLGAPPELLTPPSPWQDLAEPTILVVMRDARLSSLALHHAARVHDDGLQQDIVEIGRFRSASPYFRVVLEHGSPPGTPDRSFFVDLALRAAHAGLAVARTLPEEPLATLEGRVEMARVRLENGEQRDCLAYRTLAGPETMQGVIRQIGWLCAPDVSRADLACAIDGLMLRHRETELSLSGPVAPFTGTPSECPLPRIESAAALPADASDMLATGALAAGTLAEGTLHILPPPPRRPADR
ncbi:MAG TPA: hypothetical protein VLQ65_06580 [Saliniramus sp.]|nr:hypothetical protein [Saliniramus sp.]